jgi:hypothetical protein
MTIRYLLSRPSKILLTCFILSLSRVQYPFAADLDLCFMICLDKPGAFWFGCFKFIKYLKPTFSATTQSRVQYSHAKNVPNSSVITCFTWFLNFLKLLLCIPRLWEVTPWFFRFNLNKDPSSASEKIFFY